MWRRLFARYLPESFPTTTTNPALDFVHTPLFVFSGPHRSRHSSIRIGMFSPWTYHLSQHDPLLEVASNPKFLWTIALSFSAQRDTLVVFRFRSGNRRRCDRIVLSEPRCQLASIASWYQSQETFTSNDVFAFFLKSPLRKVLEFGYLFPTSRLQTDSCLRYLGIPGATSWIRTGC